VRRQTGNGANFRFFGSANKARVAGVQKTESYHFRRPFLVHFLGEQKMNKEPSVFIAPVLNSTPFNKFLLRRLVF
jgi:hypothetical protein